MQTLSQIPSEAVVRSLTGDGLRIAAGPFNFCIQSDVGGIAQQISTLYANHPLVGANEFIDFHVSVKSSTGVRRWFRPQALFSVDGVSPFAPLPVSQALPMIEWGLNWCITAYSHHVLILHAAAVAKNGRVAILPAPPGSGKSTLCAALVNRGWRLLSDELTIIRLDTGAVMGLARPVNLKNASIDVIKAFAPDAYLTPTVHDTTKGNVALMGPPKESVMGVSDAYMPRWFVLPRYKAGASTSLQAMATGAAFLQIADNAMNYHILGESGFRAVSSLVDRCRHFSFEYSSLDEAISVFNKLAEDE